MSRFSHTTELTRGAWIAPRLDARFGLVGSVVPTGFERYLRIFHPLQDGSSWADACRITGSQWHPLMQWRAIGGQSREAPLVGTLGESGLATLARAIGGNADVTVGMWVGYGNIAAPGERPGSITMLTFNGGSADYVDLVTTGTVTDFGGDIRNEPLLELPNREYGLFRGTLGTLRDPEWRRESGWAWASDQTINIAWPDDATWFLGSEIDFDSTLLGCDAPTAGRILESGLECALVPVDGDLSYSGDRINA